MDLVNIAGSLVLCNACMYGYVCIYCNGGLRGFVWAVLVVFIIWF